MTRMHLLALFGAVSLGLACDIPECIDGPSNLTPEATATCESPASPLESEIVSAGAQWRDDGSLVLSWTSWGLECGVVAQDVDPIDECEQHGWIFTVEIPPELAVAGVITMSQHPEVLGSMTVIHGGDAGSTGSIGDEPFFVGALELESVHEGCVSGTLIGFGTGNSDPTLGGPQLDGGFVAPTC